MLTFTINPGRWMIARIAGRNPLLRRSDRIEALVVVLAIFMSLLGASVAGVVGTAVHDARGRLFAEQAQTRRMITATAIDHKTAVVGRNSVTTTVIATWHAGGSEHTGSVKSDHPIEAGENIDIWVDRDGNRVSPPAPASRAGADALSVGVLTWLTTVLVAAALVALTRAALNRARDAQWEQEIRCLVDDDGGRSDQRR